MSAVATRQRTDPIEEFFARLGAEPQPLLGDVTATIRIDLDEHGRTTRNWQLRINRGRVRVSRQAGRADTTIKTDRAFFEQMVTGEANALAAALRGRLRLEGDIRLLVVFARVLPGPPRRTTIVPAADRTAREAARATKAPGTTARTARFSAAAARSAARRGNGR